GGERSERHENACSRAKTAIRDRRHVQTAVPDPCHVCLRPMEPGDLHANPNRSRPAPTCRAPVPAGQVRGQTPDMAPATRLNPVHTSLCDLLGIDVPIVQAPIGSASVPALAAAVSDAGGLGTIALSWTQPEGVAALVDQVRAQTSRPFHANILLEWPPEARLE